jgi:hypothetical protein
MVGTTVRSPIPDDYMYNKVVERRGAPFDLRRANPTVSDILSGLNHLFAFEFYIPVLLHTLLNEASPNDWRSMTFLSWILYGFTDFVPEASQTPRSRMTDVATILACGQLLQRRRW